MATRADSTEPSTARTRRAITERPLETLFAPVEFVGFWSAVVLPLVLYPMLLTGLAGDFVLPFAALVVANVVAALLGRDYNRE